MKQKENHTYDKFLDYCEEEAISSWVEMDTVIGRPVGKVLMTFLFACCNFMFALLLDDKTAASATAAIESLKDRLGRASFCFGVILPVILTDNDGGICQHCSL